MRIRRSCGQCNRLGFLSQQTGMQNNGQKCNPGCRCVVNNPIGFRCVPNVAMAPQTATYSSYRGSGSNRKVKFPPNQPCHGPNNSGIGCPRGWQCQQGICMNPEDPDTWSWFRGRGTASGLPFVNFRGRNNEVIQFRINPNNLQASAFKIVKTLRRRGYYVNINNVYSFLSNMVQSGNLYQDRPQLNSGSRKRKIKIRPMDYTPPPYGVKITIPI